MTCKAPLIKCVTNCVLHVCSGMGLLLCLFSCVHILVVQQGTYCTEPGSAHSTWFMSVRHARMRARPMTCGTGLVLGLCTLSHL
jgi:hypothetical protein